MAYQQGRTYDVGTEFQAYRRYFEVVSAPVPTPVVNDAPVDEQE